MDLVRPKTSGTSRERTGERTYYLCNRAQSGKWPRRVTESHEESRLLVRGNRLEKSLGTPWSHLYNTATPRLLLARHERTPAPP